MSVMALYLTGVVVLVGEDKFSDSDVVADVWRVLGPPSSKLGMAVLVALTVIKSEVFVWAVDQF